MKKLLLGAFFTAALIITGTTNTHAQTQKDPTLIKKNGTAQTNNVVSPKKTVTQVTQQNVKATKATPISKSHSVPAKIKPLPKSVTTTKVQQKKELKKVNKEAVQAKPIQQKTVKKD